MELELKKSNAKRKIFIVVAVAIFIATLGISFGYFTSNVNIGGEGSSTNASTATIEDTTLVVDGLLNFSDINIYPGHKNVSKISVTATGDMKVLYNLTWKGTNTLNTPIKYFVYKTTTDESPSISCNARKEVLNGAYVYYEECTEKNFENLGEVVGAGTIISSSESTKYQLLVNEEIQATSEGEVVYYYVVLEYPDSGNQNTDINKKFNGEISVEIIMEEQTTKEVPTVLGTLTVNLERPNFYYTSEDADKGRVSCYYDGENVLNYEGGLTEETCQRIYQINLVDNGIIYNLYYDSTFENDFTYVGEGVWDGSSCTYEGSKVVDYHGNAITEEENCGAAYQYLNTTNQYLTMIEEVGSGTAEEIIGKTGIYEEITDNGATYYFRGAVENNYMEFAGFYWRIIRVNEDGTVRMIYNGDKDKIDTAGKEIVLTNGYNDSDTGYTSIAIGPDRLLNYEFNKENFTSEYVGYTYLEGAQRPNSSIIEREISLEENSEIKKILDNWYAENLQQYNNQIASGENAGFCNDREMANGYIWSSQPNDNIYYAATERLNNKTPTFECSNTNDLYQTKIGLITVDELTYAGAIISEFYGNMSYYLYTGSEYWTMSPVGFCNSTALMFNASSFGTIFTKNTTASSGVRPVINLLSNITIFGKGTINNIYKVS